MPTKRPLIRIRDIVENGAAILQYTQGMNFDAYMASKITRDATERCLARMSEAGVKLGPLAEDLFPGHAWPALRGFGNMLRHEYDSILDETVWSIVTVHLPPLLTDLEAFVARYPEDQEVL